ncbi:sigma-70 family RNA polymerase sigma factor [bacterium]|nr:sigma-70 family RNA polymerase sigma factor [bacterium]
MPEKTALSDPTAWVDQHGETMFRYALFRLRDRALAEEVVQETFLAALQSKARFEGQSSERTWLIGILKHKIMDHFRKQRREVPLETSGIIPTEQEEMFRTTGEWIGHWTEQAGPKDWGTDPIRSIEKKEFWEALERCLAMLPPRLAQVFILREMDEMSSDEICRALAISESNLWVMLHRARLQLRRALELSYFAPEKQSIAFS